MLTHTRVLRYLTAEGLLTDTSEPITGDGELSFDGTVAASTDQEIDLAWDKTKVVSIMAYASQAGYLGSNANHAGAPADTVLFAAGQQIVWNSNDLTEETGHNNPFNTANVTKLFFKNLSATTAAIVKVRVLIDSTP